MERRGIQSAVLPVVCRALPPQRCPHPNPCYNVLGFAGGERWEPGETGRKIVRMHSHKRGLPRITTWWRNGKPSVIFLSLPLPKPWRHACVCVWMCVCSNTFIWCVSVCMFTCIHVYIHMCTHVCISSGSVTVLRVLSVSVAKCIQNVTILLMMFTIFQSETAHSGTWID